jgi:DNA-binding MarR family transcriptional regulator
MPDTTSPLDRVGPALSSLRRRTSGPGRGDLLRNLLLYVVSDVDGLTVGALAQELGVTQPVASRTVAAAVNDGLVRRVASQDDGRVALLELTDAGRAERDRFAAAQRATFESVTAGWSGDDRTRFAEYLVRYAEDNRSRTRRP